MICGMNNVNHIINKIMSLGSFLEWVPEKYEMMKLFHKYLSWKQKTEYPESFVTRLYENTALYFTLKNDIMNALKYYKKANNKEKVAELLLKNAEKHAGNGYFCKLKEYYFSIPESIVENTPELMCALSMIFSILCDPDRSEMYYSKLKSYADRAENKTQRRLAQEKIAYLNIALPHRGISGLEDIFEKYAPIAMSGHLKIQNMSVTGNMPGVINGGKDFCRWTKNDRDIYKALKTPVGIVLGKNIRGIMDIALGESLFEKNADLNFTEELTLLNSGYYEAEASGNIQLQFASIGVMALIYSSIGKLESACDAVKKLKNRIDPSEEIHDNIDAFLVNLSMLSGSCEKADEWLEEKAPDESKEFYIIDQYRYLTKIKVYIVKQMYNEALSLLDIIEQYFDRYERIICHMEALVIKSIILYRTGDIGWKDVLK